VTISEKVDIIHPMMLDNWRISAKKLAEIPAIFVRIYFNDMLTCYCHRETAANRVQRNILTRRRLPAAGRCRKNNCLWWSVVGPMHTDRCEYSSGLHSLSGNV
jgi:hypothetical protein